jgi:hypothetical protein
MLTSLKVNRHFGGTYLLHLQGRRTNGAKNQGESGDKQGSACHLLNSSSGRLYTDYMALSSARQYSSTEPVLARIVETKEKKSNVISSKVK